MTKKFSRKIEDFVCKNCGIKVRGAGYTNHCPKCLWSRHVDINPGDRANQCQGLMKPIAAEQKGGKLAIIHQCEKCGGRRRNKVSEQDDMEAVLNVIGN